MIEQRKHERFKAPEGTIALACGRMGKVIDISKGGLSLMFFDGTITNIPRELSFDIFCTEKRINARQIPGKIAWEKEVSFSALSKIIYKIIGVQFTNLSPTQHDLLKANFLNYTAGSA